MEGGALAGTKPVLSLWSGRRVDLLRLSVCVDIGLEGTRKEVSDGGMMDNAGMLRRTVVESGCSSSPLETSDITLSKYEPPLCNSSEGDRAGTGTRDVVGLGVLTSGPDEMEVSGSDGTGGGEYSFSFSFSFPLNSRMKPLLLCFSRGGAPPVVGRTSGSALGKLGGELPVRNCIFCKVIFPLDPALVERARTL